MSNNCNNCRFGYDNIGVGCGDSNFERYQDCISYRKNWLPIYSIKMPKMPKMSMIDIFKLYDMPKTRVHDDFLDSMRCAMRPGLYSTKNINKEKKEMPTNKEIREMAQHGIDNRIKMLREGELLSELEDCRFCEAFSDCNDCPFPGDCRISSNGDNDNSYKRFISHYNSEHKPYAKSIMNLGPRILCSKCLDLVNNWEADLKEIIDEHKEEHLYSLGDTFKNENRIYSLVETRPGEVQLVDCSKGFCYGTNEYIIFPKDIDEISLSEINAGINDLFSFFIHISGPTFEEEEF